MTLCPNGWSKTVGPRRFDSAAAAQATSLQMRRFTRWPQSPDLCGTITLQILFMSRNADDAVSRPGASQISEQLVREVDKQTEQDKLVEQQDTAPHRAVMHEALGNEADQPEQHNSRDDRARMMRERLDRLDVYPVAQPMRGASGRMLSHGVARLWDYFECAEEK